MKLFLAIVVITGVMIGSAARAELKDYRAFSLGQTPAQFEATVKLDAIYPNSAVVFAMGHRLLWEATGVKDFVVQDGRLTAILADDTVQLEAGLCNGLVMPDDVASIAYKNGYLLASAPDAHYIYYVPDCAHYNTVTRYAANIDTNDVSICEAAENEYIIRDLGTGAISMRVNSPQRLMATYGKGQACYFLEENGLITMTDGLNPPVAVTDAGETVLSATSDDGINAITMRGGFDFVVYDTGATAINFYEGDKPQQQAETEDAILELQDGSLRAYEKMESWQKFLLTSFDASECEDAEMLRDGLFKCTRDDEIIYFHY